MLNNRLHTIHFPVPTGILKAKAKNIYIVFFQQTSYPRYSSVQSLVIYVLLRFIQISGWIFLFSLLKRQIKKEKASGITTNK